RPSRRGAGQGAADRTRVRGQRVRLRGGGGALQAGRAGRGHAAQLEDAADRARAQHPAAAGRPGPGGARRDARRAERLAGAPVHRKRSLVSATAAALEPSRAAYFMAIPCGRAGYANAVLKSRSKRGSRTRPSRVTRITWTLWSPSPWTLPKSSSS